MSDTETDPDARGDTAGDTGLDALCRSAERLVRLAGPGLSRLQVTSGGTAVVVEWNGSPAAEQPPAAAGSRTAGEADADAEAERPEEDSRARVLAPCVGTFYHRPQPDAPPFVRPGDSVSQGQQIGVVEAMKLMTPVETDTAGLVAEILVPDGTAVEFGQPLLALEPA
ncbi:acetyl-CoA carboxylase biotin carboxyl carrier protein [Streptomyces sp. NPDC059002]|uniref:acetyl-CoA carboxylase biotin carboxyl carrier protein n=1 Tax=Streptomyces sp. NPDC059002 TaxID=3346690 RepID=UPI0036B56EF6